MTVALVLTLAWGALAFGAVYPWAYTPLGIACVAIGVLGFLPRRDVGLARVNRPLLIGVSLVAVVTALQLAPLPHETLMRLSPATESFLRRYDLHYAAMAELEEAMARTEAVRAAAPGLPALSERKRVEGKPGSPTEVPAATGLKAGGPTSAAAGGPTSAAAGGPTSAAGGSTHVSAHATSIDPAQTRLGLALFGGFAILLLGLARGLAAREVRRFAPSLVGVGVVLALVGIIQQAGFNGKIYGFWVPDAGIRAFAPGGGTFGPFVNRNHFAGWMLMALPVGLSYFCALVGRGMRGVKPGLRNRVLWFASPDANKVILVGFGLLVMGLSLVMTLSRSGITCFAIALALTGLAIARRQAKRSRRAVLATYVLFLGVLAIGWAGLDAVAGRFAEAGIDLPFRMAAWNDAVDIFRDFPAFGSGVNTFGTAMAVYQTSDPGVRFMEAHNDYVQLLAEGGLLVTIPAFILLLLFIREVRRRFRDDTDDQMTYWIRAGAVTGLIAIGLQEIVEFSLQMPGNAALFCTLMAIAAGKLPHRRRLPPA